jgi:hypothetical protein
VPLAAWLAPLLLLRFVRTQPSRIALPLVIITHQAALVLSPAFTQYGNLPLVQLVSITAIYGLTFLMAWTAAAVNSNAVTLSAAKIYLLNLRYNRVGVEWQAWAHAHGGPTDLSPAE